VAQKIEFFVSEDRKVRGPVRLEELRREFESGVDPERNILFRMEGCKRFLPGNAWDPLSDLFSTPSALDRPDGVVAEKPPRDLATLDPAARDKLLWFVEDADGVMGPVTGAFVARGLMTGRIPITAAVALVSVPGWIRATALFPAALEGATEIRMRPLGSFVCPYCLEPVIIGSTNCLMCNENVAMGEPGLGLEQVAMLVGGALAIVIIPLIVGAFSARAAVRHAPPPTEPTVVESAASADVTATNASPEASAASSASSASSSAPVPNGHGASAEPDKPGLKGEILAKFDVPSDVDDAYVLARGHVAIARRSGLDIVDPQSGVIVTTSRDVPGARELQPMDGALYAIGASRIGVLDADSLRLAKWLDLKGPFLSGAASRELMLFPSVIDRSVIVVAAPYHAELSRFRFLNDIPGLVAIEPGGAWAAVGVGDPRTRIDAVATFAPRVAPSAQIVRRTAMGDGVVALAARNGRAYAALAGGRIASVKFGSDDIQDKPSASAETCKEPLFVRAAPKIVTVGCRAGQAVALHLVDTLEQDTRIELGAPVLAMEMSSAGDQLLVATGGAAPGLFVVDLPTGAPRRFAVTDEVSGVAFGDAPGRAMAYSARAHRVWVLE
jgi:hypothetical protein